MTLNEAMNCKEIPSNYNLYRQLKCGDNSLEENYANTRNIKLHNSFAVSASLSAGVESILLTF